MKTIPFILAALIASASLHAAEPIVIADFEGSGYRLDSVKQWQPVTPYFPWPEMRPASWGGKLGS